MSDRGLLEVPGPDSVVVVGMHRSGTSLVADALERLGLDLGDRRSLMGAGADNAAGFFEQTPLVRLNEKVLRHMNGTWMAPPALPSGWESDSGLSALMDEATSLVSGVFHGVGPHGWKDPRASLTLPFWHQILNVRHAVLCLRDPSEVVQSMGARNGTDPEWGAALWLRYTASALHHAPDAIRIDYQQLFDDPASRLGDLAERLGLDTARAAEVAHQVLDPGLRHHGPLRVDAPPLLAWAHEIHEELVAGEQVDPELLSDLAQGHDEIRVRGDRGRAWREVQSGLARVAVATIAAMRDRDDYRGRAERLRDERDAIRIDRDQHLEQMKRLRDELRRAGSQVASASDDAERARRDADTHRATAEAVRSDLALTARAVDQCQQNVRELADVRDQLAERIQELEAGLRGTEQTIARLKQERDRLARER